MQKIVKPGNIRSKMVLKSNRQMSGGAILLNKGGPGSGSSYSSLYDYKETVGSGLKTLERKLNNLNIGKKMSRPTSNISFKM